MQLPREEALGILRFGGAPGKKHRVFWDFGGGRGGRGRRGKPSKPPKAAEKNHHWPLGSTMRN